MFLIATYEQSSFIKIQDIGLEHQESLTSLHDERLLVGKEFNRMRNQVFTDALETFNKICNSDDLHIKTYLFSALVVLSFGFLS